ncbi:hypothetical protein [Metabacillus rhizolycopersici]|uniref:Uncharacterized protein n=1 Tax=Metabacillus rhizolycopersici TaxID=2875709 RepID=A0ABS7UXL7_9BACI|nr:hypothetical protein [Metabacillus rhizolycopersici]MBZ5752748.1 hypothetical protein [Metabacillus rhizolycopersici]
MLQLEENTNQLMKKVEKEIKFLKQYSQNTQDFFVEHLGVYEEKLVLAKRLDSRWQKSLKKKEILAYDDSNYVWFVNNLDGLAEDYTKRTDRKNPYPTEWDYDKEKKRNHAWGTPLSPYYRLPSGLAEDLMTTIEAINKKKKEIESERKGIQKQMQQLRKTSPQSFIEAVAATNTLSLYDLKRHGELQDKALKWLFNKGYIVASEVTLPNGNVLTL